MGRLGLFSDGPVLARRGVVVRPLRRSDEKEWLALRAANRDWLKPWEATVPGGPTRSLSFPAYVRSEKTMRRAKAGFPMVIEHRGRLVGRVAVNRVEWGAERGGSLGYWVAKEQAGQGIAPLAVALLTEYVFAQGLHRIEIAIRPENEASLRVVEKLGFRDEGVRRRFLHIDGDYRDHRIFALTSEEPRVGEYWAGGA